MFYYFNKLDLVPKLNTRMNSYRIAALRVYVALLLQGLSQTISFLYQFNYDFYYIHFEITGYHCNLIGSQQCDLFALFFALDRIFISADEKGTLKQNN